MRIDRGLPWVVPTQRMLNNVEILASGGEGWVADETALPEFPRCEPNGANTTDRAGSPSVDETPGVRSQARSTRQTGTGYPLTSRRIVGDTVGIGIAGSHSAPASRAGSAGGNRG